MIISEIEKRNAMLVDENQRIVTRINELVAMSNQINAEYTQLNKRLNDNISKVTENANWIDSLKKKEDGLVAKSKEEKPKEDKKKK
ncbi:hypothetical protein KY330_02370 [Candidatus Woesearchaeota archaeon]|nr:hypothetical protein [Candidatus Woesearchaeota archaeon]